MRAPTAKPSLLAPIVPACLALTSALATVPMLALPAIAAPAAKSPTPKDNAIFTLRNGIKAADFQARGMAYRGLALDKGNKQVKQTLQDGTQDPQWVVRAGVAHAFFQLGDPTWKKLVHDALAMPVLSPFEVLPALDELPDAQVVAVILETLADKEHQQHDKIVSALVTRNKPSLTPVLVAALASKDPLVQDSAKKGVKQLDPVLQQKTLDAVGKAQAGNDEIVKILLDIGANSDDRLPVTYLAPLKPKDPALLNRLLIVRALHGDRAVSKPLVALAVKSTGKEQMEALAAFKRIANQADAAGLKPILNAGPTPDVIFAVYEILARTGDRSMMQEAQKLADSTDVDVRATGVFYLGWVGGAGRLGDMHKYLIDGIPAVRIAAARVIGYMASKISVAPLKDALEAEQDERVRLELIKALAAIKDKAAYEALMFFSREKDLDVRRIVMRALAESGDPVARQGLKNGLNDNDPRIRAEAVRGFLLSDPAEAPAVWKRSIKRLPRGFLIELTRELTKGMESYLELTLFGDIGKDDAAQAMREEALLALHLLPEAEPRILRKVLASTDDDDLRVRVLRALFEIEKNAVATDVKSLALSSGTRARVAAIRLLGKLKGDKEAAEMLVKLLDEPDERVRIAAALTFLGG